MARLRRGDQVPLKSIEQLGNSRKEVREWLGDAAELDIQIVNKESKRAVHSGDVLWVVRGVSALDDKRRKLSAKEKGKERMPIVDANPIWHDHRLGPKEALALMWGWSPKLAYKYLGPRGITPGRKPKA